MEIFLESWKWNTEVEHFTIIKIQQYVVYVYLCHTYNVIVIFYIGNTLVSNINRLLARFKQLCSSL